jgi:hypothetical protein
MGIYSEAVEPAGRGLDRLLAPLTQQQFEQEYLDRKPLHLSRADPEYFADLLTFDDLDRLLSLSGPNFENIRVAADGMDTIISDPASRRHDAANRLEAIYRHYRAGATIVLNSVNERLEPLKRLERDLHAELNAGLEMNVYLTPGGRAQGFKPHYDTHDVIVLQIYGTKEWGVYGTPFPKPLPMAPHEFRNLGPSLDVPAEPETQLEMQPGDLLYLPRGTVHAARSNETASAHLTIGVHRTLWFPLIQDALFELAARDVRLRAALPVGFARTQESREEAVGILRELIGSLLTGFRPEQIVGTAASRATFVVSPGLRGHLNDLEQLGTVTTETTVYRRDRMRYNLAVSGTGGPGSTIRLEFHNKAVELPAAVVAIVQFLVEDDGKGFTAADMPEALDLSGRLEIVRTLLREGFLTLSPADAG